MLRKTQCAPEDHGLLQGRTDAADRGAHIVCAEMTREFLDYTKAQGNDLSADAGAHFRGLVPGDRWCLCIERWLEARRAGVAPPILPRSTDERALVRIRAHARPLENQR